GEDEQRPSHALPGDGHGGFGPPLAVPPIVERGVDRVIADLNADGFPDILTRGTRSTVVTPYLGDGAFGFVAGNPLDLGDEPDYLLYLTDMDGDGTVDVAGVGSSFGFFIARGTGPARFEEPLRFVSSGQILAFDDVNGDGLKDVLTYDGG